MTIISVKAPITQLRTRYIYSIETSSNSCNPQSYHDDKVPLSPPSPLPTGIQYLNISNNCISDDYGPQTLEALSQLKRLRHINLNNNFLEDETGSHLKMMAKNGDFNQLRFMSVTNNRIAPAILYDTQQLANFTLKHQHLNELLTPLDYGEINNDLFLFGTSSKSPSSHANHVPIKQVFIRKNHIKIPLFIPQFRSISDVWNNTKEHPLLMNLLNGVLLIFPELTLTFKVIFTLFMNIPVKNVASQLSQAQRDKLLKFITTFNKLLSLPCIDLDDESIDALDRDFKTFSTKYHPSKLLGLNHTMEQKDLYRGIYFELHQCTKTILASYDYRHRVDTYDYKKLYRCNPRITNYGFVYNGLLLAIVSNDYKLICEKLAMLYSQRSNDPSNSKYSIYLIIESAIIDLFGLNAVEGKLS